MWIENCFLYEASALKRTLRKLKHKTRTIKPTLPLIIIFLNFNQTFTEIYLIVWTLVQVIITLESSVIHQIARICPFGGAIQIKKHSQSPLMIGGCTQQTQKPKSQNAILWYVITPVMENMVNLKTKMVITNRKTLSANICGDKFVKLSAFYWLVSRFLYTKLCFFCSLVNLNQGFPN